MILELGLDHELTMQDFCDVVYHYKKVSLSKKAIKRLHKTRDFIQMLEKSQRKVYGFTTGKGG